MGRAPGRPLRLGPTAPSEKRPASTRSGVRSLDEVTAGRRRPAAFSSMATAWNCCTASAAIWYMTRMGLGKSCSRGVFRLALLGANIERVIQPAPVLAHAFQWPDGLQPGRDERLPAARSAGPSRRRISASSSAVFHFPCGPPQRVSAPPFRAPWAPTAAGSFAAGRGGSLRPGAGAAQVLRLLRRIAPHLVGEHLGLARSGWRARPSSRRPRFCPVPAPCARPGSCGPRCETSAAVGPSSWSPRSVS